MNTISTMLDLLYAGKTDEADLACPTKLWFKYMNDWEFGWPKDLVIWLLLIAVAEGETL